MSAKESLTGTSSIKPTRLQPTMRAVAVVEELGGEKASGCEEGGGQRKAPRTRRGEREERRRREEGGREQEEIASRGIARGNRGGTNFTEKEGLPPCLLSEEEGWGVYRSRAKGEWIGGMWYYQGRSLLRGVGVGWLSEESSGRAWRPRFKEQVPHLQVPF
eukprot:758819-Hanusia_phi.AAC.3